MRRTLALLLTLVTATSLVAACGDDQTADTTTTTSDAAGVTGSDLDDVTITGEEGEPPVLEFDQPFGVAETISKVITEGDGEAAKAGATISFDFVFVNGADGTELGTSYDTQPTTIAFDEAPEFLQTSLDGVTAGSRVLIAVAPADGYGADEEMGVSAEDTLLLLADVVEVSFPLARAEGEAVPPVAGLPTVKLGADGAPTITVPAGEPPAALVAQPLIVGDGAVVETGQTITVHYTGVLFADGAEFDSSWTSGTPASFPIGTGGVIAGWDKGLVGVTVGSQILLVVPAVDGYGDTGSGETIPPGAALVFVVDILGVSGGSAP